MKSDAMTERDSLYRPIYSPDIKNPNAKAALEHAHPRDMITAMLIHGAIAMRVLDEIGTLVVELQA